jgi:hypothetical protein
MCCARARRVEVTHVKTVWPATLELWDTTRDLCQLKANGMKAAAVPLADNGKVVVGQPVYALGTPAGMELTMSTGIVSGLRHDDTQRLTAIQTSAAISEGSSGGGLFDDQGRLLGITTAFVGGNAQNLNLALPVSMVRELPERHASAQAAKLAAPKAGPSWAVPVAPTSTKVFAPRTEGSVPGAGALTASSLTGQWSGEYRCGAYVGTGKVANQNGWNVTALMTVTSDGSVVIVRGDSLYSETVMGDIAPDLSTTLRGRGAPQGKVEQRLEHRGDGALCRHRQRLPIRRTGPDRSATGEVSRHCTVTLTKNTAG